MLRRASALLGVLLLGVILVLGLPAPAQAAAGNTYKSWTANYVINRDGTVAVTETIVIDFVVADSHGLNREFLIQERWTKDDGKYRRYDILDFTVSADKGASTEVKRTTREGTGNTEYVSYRIGSATQTTGVDVITYTLKYTIKGALLTDAGGVDFYWDAITEKNPPIAEATIRVTIPEGQPTGVKCAVGLGSSTGCLESAAEGRTVTYTATKVGNGTPMTVALHAPAGTIQNAHPILVPSKTTTWRWGAGIAAALTAVTAVVAGFRHRSWKRRNVIDDRFLGTPPGTIPPDLGAARVGLDDHPTIPVAFSPPHGLTPGEAGKLIDGAGDVRDTTATLVDLAVRGAVRLYSPTKHSLGVVVLIPGLARAPHEVALVQNLLQYGDPGRHIDLSNRGSLAGAHRAVSAQLSSIASSARWYVREPKISTARDGNTSLLVLLWDFIKIGVAFFVVIGFGGLMLMYILAAVMGPWALLPFVGLPLLVVSWVRGRQDGAGKRSALGRALTDQVLGFRQYIATAEADQLRFEEGEDIFSKYLPWAICFDLTKRWTQVCENLVRMGRLPNVSPAWYSGEGSGDFSSFDADRFDSALANSAEDRATSSGGGSSSSGSDSGSGSSSSDSFSGGGGGGGGGSSTW